MTMDGGIGQEPSANVPPELSEPAVQVPPTLMEALLTELDDRLPVVIASAVLLALTSFLRVRYRNEEFVSKFKVPAGLLVLTLVIEGAALLAASFWPEAVGELNLARSFTLTLAIILLVAIAIFDSFLARVREVEVATILRDTAILTVFAVAVFVILGRHGTDVTSLVATSAVLTAVIGFALQDLLTNIIAGLALQAERPFKRGDWIGFAEQQGVVLELNWRSTKIKTLHNDIVVIPNSVLTKSELINYTAPSPVHRRRFVVGLRYEVPPNVAKASILKAVQSVDAVLDRPQPYVQTLEYADFSINYRVNFYINQFRRRERIEDEVRSRLWYQLRRDGLSIPFPIRDVNLRNVTEESLAAERALELAGTVTRLAQVPILEGLSEDELQELAERSKHEFYATDETVLEEGADGDSMYIIAAGAVDVCLGSDRRVIASLDEGSYFGEMSLMTGEKRSATIVARSDCDFLVVDKGAFQSLLETNDQLIVEIGAKLEERRDALAEKQRELATRGTNDPDMDTKSSLVSRIRSFFQAR